MLTKGCIARLFAGEQPSNPVVQVLGVKKIKVNTENTTTPQNDRYRIVASDGEMFLPSVMIATQLNHLITDGKLDKNTIMTLTKFVINSVKDRKVVVVMEVNIVEQAEARIGAPQQCTTANAPTAMVSPPQAMVHSASAVMNGSMNSQSPGGNVYPIASLNPYQNKWTIKARVMKKGDVRTWNNARGEGKLFSMDLMDESGEIRCTGFSESVDRFYNMVEQGKVYFISRCQLKTANKQYTHIKNDYEMTMGNDTSVIECTETAEVPQMKMNYTNIGDLESVEKDAFVDIIGVATDVSECTSITARASGKQITKREMKLMDMSGASVSMTLWGADAEKFNHPDKPILAVKAAKVSDFGGRSLSVSFSSTMMVNPDTPDSHKLRGWYDSTGKDLTARSLSSSQGGGGGGMAGTTFKSFSEIKATDLQGKPDYFCARGTIMFIKKDNCMYKACPSTDCNKKVIEMGPSEFRCEKCNKVYPNYKYRLMISMRLSDWSGQEWATAFQDTGETIVGQSADMLGSLKEQDDNKFDQVMNAVNFKTYVFKLRAKIDSYNDEEKLKCTIVNVQEVDYESEAKRQIEVIRKLEAC